MHENELGQVLFLKLNQPRWNSSLEQTLRSLAPGGVLVDAPLHGGAENVREFLSKAASLIPTVPFLALREEGGLMNPLKAFLPPLPSPRAAAGKGRACVERLGELVGAALELLGFNTDFAPLLDLASPGLNPGSGTPWRAPTETRTFSADPQQVAECGGAFLEGLEGHEVRACGKHFPGLGGARTAGATELPLVSKSMAELWREDLVPYRALLPRLPLVLVSAAAYKAYDFDLPQSAGLSPKIVEGLLRVKLGYDGMAIAYGLETEAVRGTLSLEEAAVEAVGAGCDMLVVEEPQAAERVHAAWCAALHSGKLPGPRVEQALKRIQHVKRGLRPALSKLSRRSLDKLIKRFTAFSAAFASSDPS
ncbi:MAG: glycoside hydrolase family 3 N-terminal domain-containing protein [Terriglobia bacterium]